MHNSVAPFELGRRQDDHSNSCRAAAGRDGRRALVNLGLLDGVDAGVAGHLPGDPAVTAADDQHLLRRALREPQDRQVSARFAYRVAASRLEEVQVDADLCARPIISHGGAPLLHSTLSNGRVAQVQR